MQCPFCASPLGIECEVCASCGKALVSNPSEPAVKEKKRIVPTTGTRVEQKPCKKKNKLKALEDLEPFGSCQCACVASLSSHPDFLFTAPPSAYMQHYVQLCRFLEGLVNGDFDHTQQSFSVNTEHLDFGSLTLMPFSCCCDADCT
jgi:hypothetical protein